MMDPLSISASVAGLVGTTQMIVDGLYSYIKQVKTAEEEVLDLTKELTQLYGILSQLRLLARQFEGEEFDNTLQTHHIFACQSTLSKIETSLEKHNISGAKGSIDRLRRKLIWPLNASKTKELIKDVERHKSTLGLALNADSARALLRSLCRQDEISDSINRLSQRLEKAHISQEQQRILDSLGSLDPSQIKDASLRLRQPGTGLWATESEQFRTWRGSTQAMLWAEGEKYEGCTSVLTWSYRYTWIW